MQNTETKRKYVNVELTQDDFSKFRLFLKENKIYYNASSCFNLIHVEVLANTEEIEKCDNFLATL